MKRIIIIIILLFVIYQQNFAQIYTQPIETNQNLSQIRFPIIYTGKWVVYEPVPEIGAILENCTVTVKLVDETTLVMTTADKVDTFNVARIAITMEQDQCLIAIALDEIGDSRIFITHRSMMIASARSTDTVCFRDRPTAYNYLKTITE